MHVDAATLYLKDPVPSAGVQRGLRPLGQLLQHITSGAVFAVLLLCSRQAACQAKLFILPLQAQYKHVMPTEVSSDAMTAAIPLATGHDSEHKLCGSAHVRAA